MDAELKYRLRNAPAAERNGIYEFTNASGTYNGVCIVVGSDYRRFDKYISVIALSPCDRDEGMHNDELQICLPDGREFWVHCGMLTYARRDRLGALLHKVSDETMDRIGEGIMQEMGLSDLNFESEPEPESGKLDYEKMYHDLIRTIAGWSKE